ncbi:retention module-containing protein [Campylobacter concisus]
MAKKLGTIKSISGSAEVIAVDKSGNQRVLKVGDSLYEGESVKTTSADSKVVIATNNGKELSMIGEDTLSLDPKATAGDSQVAALQKALLNGANLGDLEETAAGGNSGGRGDGMSLGETRFEHGGHYSNISASTSAINPLGAASFAGPAEGKSGGLDNGGTGGGTGFYIDTTAPVVTINSINPVDTNEKADGNPDKGIVKGHSDEPNAPVVVKDKDGKIIGSGTTDDKGNFEVTTDPIKPGDKVTVEVTDKAGNTGKGDGTAGNTVYTDTTPPTVDVKTVTPVDTNNPADGNPDKGIAKGHSDEPNAPVVVTDKDGKTIGTGTTDGNGDFTIETKPFNPGDPITATVTDKAGNKGSDTENAGNLTHPNDHTAPSEPTITFVEDTNPKDGKLNKAENGSDSDNANTTAKISIPTDAVVNDVIKYTVNGEEKSHPITDADKAKGHIEVKVPVVDGQTSTITAKIVDQAGNASKEVSGSVDVDLTIGNPKVRFLEDADNNGVLSVAEVAAIKDGKAHWVIDIPTDGSVKAGDVIQSIDSKGNWVKFVTITDEMIKDGRFEATFNVDIEKLRNGKYETPEYRFADDAGNISDSSKATLTLDSELTRQPSNPSIKFPEDTNEDGKISDKENKEGDKDAGKTTAEVVIPKDGSVKPGDKLIVTDDNGKETVRPIEQSDIDKGSIDVPVDLNPGKDNNVTAEIINPNNPNNPGKDSKVIGEDSENTKAPEAPVITEVIDDVKGYGEDTKVGNVLDVKGHLTNDKTPTIKGTAKAGSKVEIYDNGDRIGETTAKSDGSWEFAAPELTKQGEHKFTATAENKFGKSTPSNEATIDLDSIAPKLDNVKITPIDTNSKADDTAELTMGTGHTDTPNAEILFRDENNNIIGKGHANSSGDFLIQLDKAVQPGTPVFVQAIDKAGNAGTDMAIAGNIEHPNDTKGPKVDIDTVTPVDETNPSDGTPDKGIVKGKSEEPNAPVVVTDENGKTIGTGTTDDKGNFEITTTPIKPGDKVKVEVTDKAGHKGSDTETAGDTEFVDNTPPSVEVKEVTPVDTNNPADGNPDKGIVKGHSDEPNAPVVVKDKDGKTIGTGTTDDNGDFEITTDPIKPGDKVNVEVTDKAGNKGNGEGTAGNTDFADKTAPDAPVITEVIDDVKGGKFNEDVKGGTTNDSTPTFKGTAEAGSTITLKNGNDVIAENIPVKADGSWEFTPKSPLVEGEYNITATATDKAGNVSNASNIATVTIDLHTSKPTINEIIDNVEGDTGNVKNERIGWTNDNTPTLKGSTEAGATVDVYVDGRKAGSVKANEKGEWEYTTSKLSDGKHSFYAIATDEAGNVSENSGISWIKVDTNPGEVVITRITDDNGDDALNGAYEGATKDNTPTIWGTGEQYATVTVSVKDSSGKVVWSDEVYIEDSLGDWHIDVPVALNDGDYTVEASMQDYVKNPVQNSNVVNLTIDNATDKPVIKEIIDDVEGDTGDISSKNNWTNDNTPTLKGSAEAGADIKVFVDGKIAGTTKAGLDGSWEFTPRTKLSDGDHTFYVEATDKIGNKNTSDIETIKVDTNPGKVVITSVTDDNGDDALNGAYEGATKDNTPTINGFAEPYSTVTVSVKDSSGKVVWSGEVYVEDSLGDWSITVDKPLNDGDYTVEASMQDYVKNPVQNSNVVSLTVDTATNIPEIKEIVDNVAGGVENGDVKGKVTNDNTPTLKGSAEAGADIKVFVDGKIAGTTKAGLDGSWEFTPRTKLGDGEHKFVVEATDKLGHSAKSVEASVDVDTTIGNPKVRFVEDTNNDGVLSVAEVAAIKDGKAHWVIDIPTDGSVKAGDVIQSIDGKGNWVKFVEITDEMIKDGRFEATFNVGINKLKDGKYETPEYRFADEAGNVSDSSKATLTLDSEFSRKPSNPEIKFPEDTNKDGKISDDENKAGDKDAGKTTVEVTIPKDGSVKPGDKVVVTDDNGKKTEKPINQDDIDKGKIDIPVDLNPGKDNNVTAEIINPNNPNNPGKDSKVIGEASSTVKVTIDEIIDDVTGGVVNGDVKNGLTNDNLPTFKGSAAPGATVEIYESFYTTTEKTLVGKTVADANGKWSFTPTEAMGDGEHYFEAVATDKVGNKSTSDKVSLDVDTFADAPVIDAVNDNVDSQTGNVLDAKTKVALTNDSTPTLEGYAEPDSVITIYEISELNGEKTAIGTVTADNHGGWKFELPELGDGEYKYTTRAQDKAGNISDFSEVVVVNADLIAPSEPTITFVEDVNPKDGKLNKAENSKDGDSTSTKAQISVPGDAEENDVIHYTVNGEEKTHTITYNDRVTGYVEIKVPVVDGKASSVTAKIVDQAGNASKEVSSSIDSDFTAPNVKITGIIDNVEGGVYKGNVAGTNTNDNKPTIKGTADANQEVVLYDNNKEFGRATADKDGNWEFKPSDYKEPLADLVGRVHVIKAVVTDAAGNTSEATSALEVDTTIGAPKVSIKEDADHNGVLSVEEAKNLKDSKIHWEVEIPKDGTVSAGDVLQVLGKDGKWKIEKVLSSDDLGKSFEYEATLSGKHFESPSYRIVDLVGNQSTAIHANVQLDSEFSRKPSNPEIKFPEDTNKDGKISDDENKAGDKDAGKTTVEVTIPKDGSVKPGDKVVVTDDNGKKTEKPINQDDIDKGKIDIPVDLNPGKDNNVTAEIINPNNPNNPGKDSKVIGEASSTVKVTIDEIIDDVTGGVVNGDVKNGLTNDNLPTFKGSAAPGATVEIYESFYTTTEKTLVGKTVADANGKWSFTPTEAMGDGEHYFEAVATDKVGNKSTSDKVSLDVDTFADAPVIDAVNDNVDSQTGNVLDAKTKVALTNDSTPTLEGYAEPDSVITIYEISELNGEKTAIGTVTADNHGGWKFELPELGDGEYKYTTRAQDKAGNISDFSEVVVVNADLIAPSEPTITFVEDVNPKDGKLNKAENSKDGDSTSTKAQISVPGDAEENDVIHYTVNGEEKTHTITYNDRVTGYVEIKVPVVDGKASSVTAKIVDQAGNASKEVSNNLDVDIHIDAPVITAVTDNWWGGVENGGNILGVNDGFTNDTTPTFKGTAEAGSTIVLKNGNDIINKDIIVKADANGNWEFTPKSPLAEGEYNVVAIATDKAGNVSNPSNVATVNVDTSTTQPVITEIIDDVAGGVVGNVKNALTNDNLPTLKGTAEAFSTVKIMVDDKIVFKDGKEVTVTADKDGNWEYTFEANLNWGGEVHAALEDGVHTLKVQTTDRAGNRSAVSEWSSVDVDTTIGAPTVKITTDINSDKKIDIADASALKDGKLKWVIDIPENTVKAGDRVQILGSDATWTDIFKVTAQDIAKGFIERDEFSIDMPKSRGFQTPSYRLVDDAGNVSEGNMDAVKIVGFAPKAPTIIAVLDNEYGIDPKNPTDINAGDTTGNVLEGTIAITNDNTPTLMGKAEAGTTITLKNGDKVIADNISVDANGNWHYEPKEDSPWADGDYEIKAIAKNVFGKESESSSPITVTVDTTAPEVTLTSIEDSVKTNDVVDFTGNVKDKFTNDNTPLLKGTAEAGSVIIIKYGEHHENEVTTKADKNGHWEYKITNPLSDGEHIISYQAVDKAGNTSLEYVANVTVDTKIVDLRIDYLGDKNHDGKYSWSDNISNENNVIYCCARFSKEAVDQGLIKVGDKLYYEVHSNVGAWNKGVVKEPITITELDLKRGYVDLTSVANITYPSKELIPFGKTANGFNLSAKAYLVDEAGNMGKQASEDLVFDFSDKPADPVKNIKINAEAIYGDNDTGLWLEGHGPVLKASTELQPQLNGNDNYEIDVKTITHKAEFTLGSGDDVVNIHKSGNGWGWINMDSKIDLGDGNNRLIVAADLDSSTVISGKGDDYIEIKDDVANGAKIITGAGNDTVIVGDTVANTIFTKVGISTGDGNDSVTIKGDAIDKAKIDLGNGDDTLTIKAAHVIGGVDDKGALDGGKGYDKLIISSPEDTIDLKHVSYHAKNFEELDISGDKNTTLKVGIEDVLDMTDDKHTLKITGDKGDTVDLKEDVKGSGWHQGASEDGYTTYTNNTVTIQIKDEIHVI